MIPDADVIGTKPDRIRDLPLFAVQPPPCPPKPIRATTSLAAHRTLTKWLTKRQAVLLAIQAAGRVGTTRKILSEQLFMPISTVNPRCRELLDATLVHETGAERHGEHLIFAGPLPPH